MSGIQQLPDENPPFVNMCNEDLLLHQIESGSRVRSSRGKKKEYKDTRKMREIRKEKRNAGLVYTTKKGKNIPERLCKPLQPCRMQCKDKIPENIQLNIFKNYWNMKDYNRRMCYILGLIDIQKKNTTRKRIANGPKNREITVAYHLIIDKERMTVCKICFKNTLGESPMFLENVVKKKKNSNAGIVEMDKRGLLSPPSTTPEHVKQMIKDHLTSIPHYESHYTRRDSSKKYLPPHWNLVNLFEDYKSKYSEYPTNRKMYESIFYELNLCFKKPNKDTCMTCDKLSMLNKSNPSENTTNELSIHHKQAELAYTMKHEDKILSLNDTKMQTFTFDMQQCLPTPVLTSSLAFYKRQLWTYNLTIHDCDKGQAYCYIWNETIANRGANDVASCLYKYLMNLNPSIEHVIMYSDTCGGQNKNSHVAAMCLVALQNSTSLKMIDHKFLIPGHTHMESDSDHSIIEKKKKKFNGPIEHPHDWSILIKQCGKNKPMNVIEMVTEDFINFSKLYTKDGYLSNRKEDQEGIKFNWRTIKWLHYEKNEPYTMFFKTELDKEDFTRVSLQKKGNNHRSKLIISEAYDGLLPISKEKKKDLMELLPYISPVYHDFYKNLESTSKKKNVYPDTIVEEQEDIFETNEVESLANDESNEPIKNTKQKMKKKPKKSKKFKNK